ncbi:MAG: type II secretion system protein GspG [Pseudomonadales bacterium]|nr:type II secretion system protein GspG [Pseudomonadales bacterium]
MRKVVMACLLVALLAACSDEKRARDAFRSAMSDSDRPVAELRADLEALIERWPESEAARRAAEELESLDALAEATARGLSLRAWDAVRSVAQAAERFRLRHGRFPKDVRELIPRYIEDRVADPWGGEVLYVASGRGYKVISYGSDGMPGGTGDAADVMVDSQTVQR